MNATNKPHDREEGPILPRVFVLVLSIAALLSALGMLRYGGVFSKITPILVLGSIILGGLLRQHTKSPTRTKFTLIVAILLATALLASVFSYVSSQ